MTWKQVLITLSPLLGTLLLFSFTNSVASGQTTAPATKPFKVYKSGDYCLYISKQGSIAAVWSVYGANCGELDQ